MRPVWFNKFSNVFKELSVEVSKKAVQNITELGDISYSHGV
jgi:hypothetical protein